MDAFVRYYDPVAGRFLSTDPVLTDENSGASFNRYTYANNNPYKYVDPDGRQAAERFVEAHRKAMETGNGKAGYQSLAPLAAVGVSVMLVYPVIVLGPEIAAAGSISESAGIGAGTAGAGGGAEATRRALQSGSQGASGELTTTSGNTYLGNSTGSSASGGVPRAPMNPQTQQALDGVKNPSRTHGHCCEIDSINKALNAGESVQGAKMGPVKLNESGKTLPACSTCREVKKSLGVE